MIGGRRSNAQTNYDALMAALAAAVDGKDGRPLRTTDAVVSYELLQRLPVTDLENMRCDLVGAGPVPPSLLRRLAADSAIGRLIADADGVPLELGTQVRLFTAQQRRALRFRDQTCVWPGCDLPGEWTEMDHAIDAALDGPTDIRNGRFLCVRHHHLRHKGWDLVYDPVTKTLLGHQPPRHHLDRRRGHHPPRRPPTPPADPWPLSRALPLALPADPLAPWPSSPPSRTPNRPPAPHRPASSRPAPPTPWTRRPAHPLRPPRLRPHPGARVHLAPDRHGPRRMPSVLGVTGSFRAMGEPGGAGPIGPYPPGVDTEEQQDEYDRLRRRVLWTLPSGLYVVGSRAGERRNGMTVNWVVAGLLRAQAAGHQRREDGVHPRAHHRGPGLRPQHGVPGGPGHRAQVHQAGRGRHRGHDPQRVPVPRRPHRGARSSTRPRPTSTARCARPSTSATTRLFIGEVVDVGFQADEDTEVLRMEDTRMNYGG